MSSTPTASRADEVRQTILQALQNLNAERGADEQIDIQPDTCLFGEGSVLDSLALVSVIVDLETAASDRFGQAISLTDDRAMARDPVPFSTVQALQAYILELLG